MNESTNFGLKTTGDNDQWRNTLDYHNENMGVIDAVLANNQNALGIIVDGNKAAVSATAGQYIILRNSTITGKTDGLYTAAKSIPANTAIDGTYLTAVSGGGLNALNSKITSINGKITSINGKIENNSTTTLSASGLGCTYIKRGGYCYVRINGTPTTTSNITFTIPKALVGAYVTCGQWASTSNQMQTFIDADSTTLTIRNHALVGVNVTIIYPYA